MVLSTASALCALAVLALSTATYTIGDLLRAGHLDLARVALSGALLIVGAVLIELGKCVPRDAKPEATTDQGQ